MLEQSDKIEQTKEAEKAGKKRKLKLYIIIGITMIIVFTIVVAVSLLVKRSSDSKDNDNKDIKVNLSTIPLPADIEIDDGHYLFDGNIFICYKRNTTNFIYFGVISEDGKNFKELYGKEFIVSPKANGIRLIPFRDNKRVY